MKWFGLAALFGCNSDHIVRKGSLASGPFEICWEVTESRSGAWFNNGGNFNAKQYTASIQKSCWTCRRWKSFLLEEYVSLNSSDLGLVKKMGERFNEELGKGKFQEHFGRYQ